MPITKLDPVAALITIDLQKGIAGLPTAHLAADVIANAARLAKAFREHKLPVVLVNVGGGAPGRTDMPRPNIKFTPDWTDLVPELTPQPSDHRVTKHAFGAFLGTDLDAYLRGKGVTQIFLAGISTSVGVESTARSAYDLGYNVVFISDAMTDRVLENHKHSIEKIFPRLGEIDTTQNVLAALAE